MVRASTRWASRRWRNWSSVRFSKSRRGQRDRVRMATQDLHDRVPGQRFKWVELRRAGCASQLIQSQGAWRAHQEQAGRSQRIELAQSVNCRRPHRAARLLQPAGEVRSE